MKTAALAIAVLVLSACSAWDKAAICCDGGYEYRHPDEWTLPQAATEQEAHLAALHRDRQRLGENWRFSLRSVPANEMPPIDGALNWKFDWLPREG